jgi:hypothetical protein
VAAGEAPAENAAERYEAPMGSIATTIEAPSAVHAAADTEGTETLYVTTLGGGLFAFDGTDWRAYSDGEGFSSQDTTVPFVDITDVASDDFSALLVATDGFGYYEVDRDSLEPSQPARAGNYLSSPLATSAMTLIESDGNLVFAGTASQGLWRNEYDSAITAWARE